MRARHLGMVIGLVLAAGTGTAAAAGDDPETFFERKVRPVLAGTCVKCHGAKKASGGLRLDSREAMLKGGDSGAAIVPGDPDNSLLLQAVRRDDESLKMPPDDPLPAAAQADLAAWIAAGASWPRTTASRPTIEGKTHWAFDSLQAPVAPDDPGGWAETSIDRFIAREHRRHQLVPVAPADRRSLIRRVAFDLTGLPPEPERVEAFVADTRPDAYERLVEELLASPRYGERWGRYWLDLARYADTAGDNSDYPIPEARLYRDYVIDAFNADLPYDRFLHEQLAGDLLARGGPPEDSARRIIATGFIAQAKRFGTHKLEDIHQIIEDTLNTTGQVVLGLSLRCARCHDHKFDPIPTRDYYALYGFFASTKYPFAGSEEDRKPSEFAPLIGPEEQKAREQRHAQSVAALKEAIQRTEHEGDLAGRLQDLDRSIAESEERRNGSESSAREAIDQEIEARKTEQAAARKRLADALGPLRAELARKEKESPLAGVAVAYAVREGTPANVRIQKGGDPRSQGETVPRGVLTCLDAGGTFAIAEGQSGRLELARWLTSGPAAPLTARVMVNRIWQHHFGKPIVATPSDFGLRGTPPTHPELLDWLAGEFIASGWSIKAMHRRILHSKTYRLACADDPADAAADSGNAWYWRFDRRPLDAESLRDTLLRLGDNLDLARPAAHPFPPVERWRFTAHRQFKADYPSNHRSVYLMVQRLHPHPYLALFNGPDTSMTTARRDESTVPLQALYLLNSPFVHEQAGKFAQGLMDRESEAPARVRLAYLEVFARPPTEPELARVLEYLARYEQKLAGEAVAAERRSLEAWSSLARILLASNEFVFVN